MKKVYQGSDWKRLSRERQARALLKAQEGRALRGILPPPPSTYPVRRHSTGLTEIEAPPTLSVGLALEETLLFFEAVYLHLHSQHSVYLNLERVRVLTPDAVAYTLSMIEHTRRRGMQVAISGSHPIDETCHNTLTASGFYKYVFSDDVIPDVTGTDILSIESGAVVLPLVAARAKNFVTGKLGTLAPHRQRTIYKMFIECMANTKNHAYQNYPNQRFTWWLMASYDAASQCIDFTFIDNGLGIPATVRRKLSEKGMELIVPFDLNQRLHDGELIASALRGELRSSTKLGYRGKGLPSLREAAERSEISQLRVLSRRGTFDCETGTPCKLSSTFRGTLISWKLTASPALETLAPNGGGNS